MQARRLAAHLRASLIIQSAFRYFVFHSRFLLLKQLALNLQSAIRGLAQRETFRYILLWNA